MIYSRVNGLYIPPKSLMAKVAGVWSNVKAAYARSGGSWLLKYKWGDWFNTYSFDYIKGTNVNLTITPVMTVPANTRVVFYAGESLATLTEINPNTKTAVIFTDTATGLATLYIRIELYSVDGVTFPVVSSLGLKVEQAISLFTIATAVLTDGLAKSRTDYHVDGRLQEIGIPFSWFSPASHRDALTVIAEACGGSVYQDKTGLVVVQSALGDSNGAIEEVIGQDRIIDTSTPVSEIINKVEIQTKPYFEEASELVWELNQSEIIFTDEEITYDISFSGYDAVIDPVATILSFPAGATILSQELFPWGGKITVKGSADMQEINIQVNGKPLVVRGAQVVSVSDDDSIRRNGERILKIENNQLIQDRFNAERVAEGIIALTSKERRDVEANWRGDPTLELGDVIELDGQRGILVEQQITHNGALASTIKIRRK